MKIAIVGSGISGLTCAYLLNENHDITIFEKNDYIGVFAVSTGFGIEKKIKQFENDHDDYNAIMLKALADRFAEAFAECLHEKIRKKSWGYASDEKLENEELISEKYKGIRK